MRSDRGLQVVRADVAVERVGRAERGVAVRALEGVLGGARLAQALRVLRGLVHLQQVQVLEAGTAHAARPGQGVLALVGALVRQQMLPAAEAAATGVAPEGPLRAVRLQVPVQVVADGEAGRALRALEWAARAVARRVPLEVVPLHEGGAALRAPKRPLPVPPRAPRPARTCGTKGQRSAAVRPCL